MAIFPRHLQITMYPEFRYLLKTCACLAHPSFLLSLLFFWLYYKYCRPWKSENLLMGFEPHDDWNDDKFQVETKAGNKNYFRGNWHDSGKEQGRIHSNPVADSWAGAVIQRTIASLEIFVTDGPTDMARCRVACPRLKITNVLLLLLIWHGPILAYFRLTVFPALVILNRQLQFLRRARESTTYFVRPSLMDHQSNLPFIFTFLVYTGG